MSEHALVGAGTKKQAVLMVPNGRASRLGRAVLTMGFLSFATAAIVVAKTPSAGDYEISIYGAFPLYFWALMVFSVSSAIAVLFLVAGTGRSNSSLLGAATFSVLLNNAFLILLPSFRGYYLGFGPAWDALSHIGEVQHIVVIGSISEGNFYPMLHLLGATLSEITGFSAAAVASGLLVGFYALFVLSAAILGRLLRPGVSAQAAFTALAAPLIFSHYTRSLQPSVLATLYFPLMLYLWHKRAAARSAQTSLSVLLILCAFFLTFFHPLTALLVIGIFLVFAAWLSVNKRSRAKERSGRTPDRRRASAANFALVMLVTFLIWYLSFTSILGSVRGLVLWLGGEGRTPVALEQIQVLSGASLTPGQAANLLLNLYGAIVIYLGLGVASLAILISKRKSVARIDLEIGQQYGVQFVTSVMLAAFLLVAFSILSEIVRLIAFPLVFSIVLVGFTFAAVLDSSSTHTGSRLKWRGWNRKAVPVLVVAALVILSGALGIMNLFGSSRTFQPNQEVTETEASGFDWFFLHGDSHLVIYSNLPANRMGDLLFCYKRDRCPAWITLPIPPRFSYYGGTSIGGLLESRNGVLITTTSDRLLLQIYPSDLQPQLPFTNFHIYLESDFQHLAGDPTLVKSYDNGGLMIWVAGS